MKLGLSYEEIPKINRKHIKDYKLWGALNRFKSIKRLIHFVYPNLYIEHDFTRVPKGYWLDRNNIRQRLEYHLAKNHYAINDIPSVVTYDQLVTWGFSNPLKRYDHSPFKLVNALYPNMFHPYQFRKIPQRSSKDKSQLKNQFLRMLDKENIEFKDVPKKVTQEILNKHRFSGALKYYNNSPQKLVIALFPKQFQTKDFRKTNGYWKDKENAKDAIIDLIKTRNVPQDKIPQFITKKFLSENGLAGLLHENGGSPINIINKLFPDKFDITEFQRVPNRYWYEKDNRISALRSYYKRKNFEKEDLLKLNRSYFQQYFPRFISVVDRHYSSKFYLWVMEAFPEHNFKLQDFHLHIGDDGQICDSKEELTIHNYLINQLGSAVVTRENKRFSNCEAKETYIPDWIVVQGNKKYIIEYFGLYNSSRYPDYTAKTNRKVKYYRSLQDYRFIAIMPADLNKASFKGVSKLLVENGLIMKDMERV